MKTKNTIIRTIILGLIVLNVLSGCVPYTKGEPISTGLQSKPALIVVDMQKDFIYPTGRLPVDQQQAQAMIQPINELINRFKRNDLTVIYVGNEYPEATFIVKWFLNCATLKGSAGAELIPEIDRINDLYFPKDQSDAFSNPAFDQLLRNLNISEVIITGV